MKADLSINDSINKSQFNNSTAKVCFSFSKAPRSPNNKGVNDLVYNLPSMLSQRATSIGFGKKMDIAPRQSYPSPDKYEKPSDFEKSPKKGISFGLSRQNIKAVSIFLQTKNPGPGQYDNTIKEYSKTYAIRGRDGFPQNFQSVHTPGPGQYEIKQETDKQFYIEARRKSPPIYSIRKGKQNTQKSNGIGPGSYETSLASMGRQILGNKKSQRSFCFPKQTRDTFVLSKSQLGPGSYEIFSEFGK